MKDEPAFPMFVDFTSEECMRKWPEDRVPGLTKREYFAGLAMQGMISGITKFKEQEPVDGPLCLAQGDSIIVNRPKDISELSILYADALIAELEKGGSDE